MQAHASSHLLTLSTSPVLSWEIQSIFRVSTPLLAWHINTDIYGSVIAGEARDPRRTVPRAFKTIIPRLMIFPHRWLPLRRCK
jgi:hypothetical protein